MPYKLEMRVIASKERGYFGDNLSVSKNMKGKQI